MNNLEKANRSIWNLAHLAHGLELLGFDTKLESDTLHVFFGDVEVSVIDFNRGLDLSHGLTEKRLYGQIKHLYRRYLLGDFGSEYGRRYGLSA